jgi:hypothetical protein
VGRGNGLSNGIGSGGGHGGKGGSACYNDNCVDGGVSYGDAELPCELGSGSGQENSSGSTAGGGIIGKLVLWINLSANNFQLCFDIHMMYYLLSVSFENGHLLHEIW